MNSFFDHSDNSTVAKEIESLNLSSEQSVKLKLILDGILTDTFYTLLLGLEGEVSIGGVQSTYKLFDEDEKLISDCGEIEAEAWEQFHG